MAPMTQEELETINSIYVDFDFSEEIEYLHLGTTVFHNRSISFDGTKIKLDILNDIQSQIAKKGYKISHSRESSDVIISLVPKTTYNPPSESGVDGYGFFNHVMFNVNYGISAQASFIFKIEDSISKEILHKREHNMFKRTGVKTKAKSWDSFSDFEKQKLQTTLVDAMREVVEKALKSSGL